MRAAPFAIQLLEKGGASLCITNGPQPVYWKLALTRGTIAKGALSDAVASFDPFGSRHTAPMNEPHNVDAERVSNPDTPAVAQLAQGLAEYGLQTDDESEYFFSKGALVGILRVKRRDDGAWSATMAKTLSPRVLSPEAVEAGMMPPDGYSALPESLEKIVPSEFRYWEHKGDDARAVRDALVESGFFSDDCIKAVDGELRKVEVKYFLYEPPSGAAEKRAPAKPLGIGGTIAKLLPDGLRVFNPFLDKDWRATVKTEDAEDALFILSPPEATPAAKELAEVAKTIRGHWLIELDDTQIARAELLKAGPTFLVAKRLMATSFPITDSSLVKFVAPVAVGKPFAGYTDFAACVAAQKEKGKDDESARAICGALQRDTEKRLTLMHTKKAFGAASVDMVRSAVEAALQEKFPPEPAAEGCYPCSPYWVCDLYEQFAVYQKDGMTYRCSYTYEGGKAALGEPEQVMRTYVPISDAGTVEQSAKALSIIRTVSKADEERYVLGIVLEPDVVDAQSDTYNSDEVRNAEHVFMERYRNMGLMHKGFVNEDVKILESYIAPVDFDLGGIKVKKGTWLMAVRVLSDKLWDQVKGGGLTGFSIGGNAIRVPA